MFSVVFVRAITEALILAVQTTKDAGKLARPSPSIILSPTGSTNGRQSDLSAEWLPDSDRPVRRRRTISPDTEVDGELHVQQQLEASMTTHSEVPQVEVSVDTDPDNQTIDGTLEAIKDQTVQSGAVGLEFVEEPGR